MYKSMTVLTLPNFLCDNLALSYVTILTAVPISKRAFELSVEDVIGPRKSVKLSKVSLSRESSVTLRHSTKSEVVEIVVFAGISF